MPDHNSPRPPGNHDDALPALQITRHFDFGQFVFLHSEFEDAREEPQQVVIDPTGGKYAAYHEWLVKVGKIELAKVGPRPPEQVPHELRDPLGGLSLDRLVEGREPTAWAPTELVIDSAHLKEVVSTKQVPFEDKTIVLELDEQAVASLSAGRKTLVMAGPHDGGTQPFLVELAVDVPLVQLSEPSVDRLLADGRVDQGAVVHDVELHESVTRALLDGRPAVAWTKGRQARLLRLEPPSRGERVTAAEVVVDDMAGFLTRPLVPGTDGRPVSVTLSSAHVSALRLDGTATVTVGDDQVTLVDGRREAAAALDGRRLANRALADRIHLKDPAPVQVLADGVAKWTKISGAPPAPANPIGLPVAVFLPWRQTWALTGFSQGDLRSSLALAPQEEMTIEVSSWERRLRTLDQSSQTDVEQSFESVQTQRDTDDVFSELTNRHDFAWQLEGSVDATYSTGNGSITVGAGGQVSDTSHLQSIARVTQQRVKESTQKSAARVRAIRTTRITDAVETGEQTRVTRKIKNANFSRTLTLDFFETLAHYRVTLAPRPERMMLVALLPNPLATKEFTRELVRRHESTLQRALLDGSLSEGFAACRKTRAYEKAKEIISDLAALGGQVDSAADGLGKGKRGSGVPVPTAQEKAVVELLTHIAAAYKKFEGATPDAALKRIPPGQTIQDEERADAQHWLFLRLAGKYLPSVVAGLAGLPKVPAITDAEPLVAVIPAPGSATTLESLNDKSDWDKEQAGLGVKIGDHVGRVDWNWSSGRAREEGLYTAGDGGISGLLGRLQQSYGAYLAKRSQGDMEAEKEVVIAQANAQQDRLSTADQLAMAFPLDELAAAREREEALLSHLNEHPDHYSFALFQGLSPAEQARHIEAGSKGALKVGMFEPRVIAVNGPHLAVPLAPQPAGELRDFVEVLRTGFRDAFGGTADTPDELVFPTPGLTISTRLGERTTAEDYVERSRAAELRRLVAEARAAELEADRRRARIKRGDLEDPELSETPFKVSLEQPGDD
ncbi:hypothetical protein [Sphaerisporangium sp. TRM90804]|uniref:hypothetical protein n=1 Tax=Sphaerisporangium sp. TRM90804 TaxID=3031113 RepID=UPI002448FF02|nr:hypothetical protein [Sphaerisporangium sp. TRM90804]MDH2427012.1 hypothetical protein [Sphaerisporangium sp. TRM90804]